MNRLALKLQNFGAIGDDDRRLLDRIVARARPIGPHRDLIQEGDPAKEVHLITDGFACRYKLTADGRRSIMAYLVPGDLCDLHISLIGQMDHSIGTLAPCMVALLPPADVEEITRRPALTQALLRAALVDEAISREWLVNISTREAPQAVAHLFCELLFRLSAVGLADGGFDLPLSQAELADTAGLSTVHMNRTLQTLRAMKLISFEQKRMTVLDPERLIEFSGFNPNYLHLVRNRSQLGSAA